MHNRPLLRSQQVGLFALLLVLAGACKKDPAGPNDNTPFSGRQVNIPWPGLANSPWPARNHDPQHTGRSEYRGPQLGQMGWRYEAQSSLQANDIYASPVLGVDGTIYFGNFNSREIIALRPDGTELWKNSPGGSDGSCIVGNDGTIYCSAMGTDVSRLFAYGSNGSLKWSLPLTDRQGFAPYTPVISKDGETIYVPHGILYAVTKAGIVRWKMAPDSTDVVGRYPSMSPDGATIYVPGQGALYAVDTSGHLKWKFTPGTSEAAIDNAGNLYVTVENSELISLSPQGTVRWRLSGIPNGWPEAGPAIGWDGTVYLAGAALWAVSAQGTLKWRLPLPNFAFSQCVPAIDADGTVYFGRIRGQLPDSLNFIAVNPDGTIKFKLTLSGLDGRMPDLDSNPAISSAGRIYIGSDRPTSRWFFEVK